MQLTSNEKQARRKLFEADCPFTTVCSGQENNYRARGDGDSQLGGLGLPSVVEGPFGVLGGIESGLKLLALA